MALPAHKLSLAEFLEWENARSERNEFDRKKIRPLTSIECELTQEDVFKGV